MTTKTILIQTEIPEGRIVVAYFMQVIYDDNGKEIGRSKTPHVVTFTPDSDYDKILASVNSDITTRENMQWAPIEDSEWQRAVGHCEVEHTPEIKEAYAQYKAVSKKT